MPEYATPLPRNLGFAPNPYLQTGGGLLGGLLDSDGARLGISLLAAAGPSLTPVGFGQRLQAGMGAFDDYKREQLRNRAYESHATKGELEVDKLRREMADDQATRDVLKGAYSGGLPTGPVRFSGPTGAVNDALPPDLRIGALPGLTPKSEVWSRYRAIGDQLAQQGLVPQAQKYFDLAEKFRPKFSTTPQVVTDPVTGKTINVLIGEDGTIQPVAYGVKPDIQLQDLGGTVAAIDKNATPGGQTFAKTMTPGEVASNQVAWANNRLGWANQGTSADRLAFDRQQAGKPQFHDGQWVYPPSMQAPQGTVVSPPGVAPKPLTEFQGKSTNYAARMLDASRVIDELTNQPGGAPYASSVAQAGYRAHFPDWLPGGQALAGLATTANNQLNPMVTKDAQRYRQAQENWVTANLRQESGAAIGRDEMDKDVRKWFPEPGDSDAVIRQKADARRVAERAMLVQAGQGAKQVPGIVGDGGSAQTLPANPSASNLTKGTVYKLPNGVAGKWNGMTFEVQK